MVQDQRSGPLGCHSDSAMNFPAPNVREEGQCTVRACTNYTALQVSITEAFRSDKGFMSPGPI